MVFPENLILEDERVLLRPLEFSDFEFLRPFASGEPLIWIYSHPSPAGEDRMKQYMANTIAQRDLQKEYPFIVFDKKTGRYAGSTRFYDIQLNNLTTQLGYTWYGADFQRTGLNRHCKWLLLSYAFETWGMERVEFRANLKNERSIRAMKEIGCVVEGVLRSNSVTDGPDRRDTIVLSILKSEWFGTVKENLAARIRP